jgi:hypothetical protein
MFEGFSGIHADNAVWLILPTKQRDSRNPEEFELMHTSAVAMSAKMSKPRILCTYLPQTSDPPNSTDIALLWVHTKTSVRQIIFHDYVNRKAVFSQIVSD